MQRGRGHCHANMLQKAKYNYNVHSYIEYTLTIYYHHQVYISRSIITQTQLNSFTPTSYKHSKL